MPPFNISTRVNLVSEHIHVERDLGCIPMSRNTSFDNHAKLAPVLGVQSRVTRRVFFPGERYRINSTLNTAPRHGLVIEGIGGGATPSAESQFQVNGDDPTTEYGGPQSELVWGGDPGTGDYADPVVMMVLRGGYGKISGLSFRGQWAATDSNDITTDIDYDNGPDIGLLLSDGDIDLPNVLSPGKWDLNNISYNCLRTGFAAARTYASNHADSTHHSGITNINWCYEGVRLIGQQAVQFLFDFIHPLEVNRVFNVQGGGQIHVLSGRLQGRTPTWLYLGAVELSENSYIFDSIDADGTLVDGYKWVDYDDAAIGTNASGTNATIIFNCLSNTIVGYSKPVFRLKGAMSLHLNSCRGLEERSVECHSFDAVSWGLLSNVTMTPNVIIDKGMFRTHQSDSNATNSLYHNPAIFVRANGVSPGDSSGTWKNEWMSCRTDSGLSISNGTQTT